MPAGPSEVYVVSNDIEKLDIIAADLLSQLEHSSDAKGVLISQNKEVLLAIKNEINKQKKTLSRQDILNESLKNIYLVKAKNAKEIINFINDNAPEHLILLDDDFSKFIPYINNAGSVFVANTHQNHLEIMHLDQIIHFLQIKLQKHTQGFQLKILVKSLLFKLHHQKVFLI